MSPFLLSVCWLSAYLVLVLAPLLVLSIGPVRETSGPGTQAQSQPDPIPWCLFSEQQTPGVGDPGPVGQGQPESCRRSG